MKSHKPYFYIKKWQKIVEVQLYIFVIFVIICSIIIIIIGEDTMWKDILLNIGVNVITSIAISIGLSIFIYFKYLKRIPDENRKQIDDLLNSRLGYETTNHNSVIVAIKTDTRYIKNDLSLEHSDIKNLISDNSRTMTDNTKFITDSVMGTKQKIVEIKSQIEKVEYEKELRYANLHASQKEIVDSIDKLSNLGKALKKVHTDNINLKENNIVLSTKLEKYKEQKEDFEKKHKELLNKYNDLVRNSKNELSKNQRNNYEFDLEP